MQLLRTLGPGSLRWLAAGLLAIVLVVWLGSAFFREVMATGSIGRLWLRSGCLHIEYAANGSLPPNLHVTTLEPWPAAAERGVFFSPPNKPGLQWWPVSTIAMTTAGAVSTTNGPNPVMTVASATVRHITVIPLWPAVLVLGMVTFVSWRRRLRHGPGQCPRCAYDRRGLATPDAACPECGTVPIQ